MTESGTKLSSALTVPENVDELKNQLLEMQTKISRLENELNSQRKKKEKISRETWIFRLILLIVLFLAIIPPSIVVADRWLHIFPTNWHRETWCKIDFLCRTFLPSYFSIIIGCFITLAIILFFLRKKLAITLETPLTFLEEYQVGPVQLSVGYYLLMLSEMGIIATMLWSGITKELPGWDLLTFLLAYLVGWALRAIPFIQLIDFWKQNGEYWVALILAHISLITLLAAYYDVNQILVLSIFLSVCAFLNLWRFRKRVPPIYWLVSITLIFYTLNINAWWTSIIGDDYGNHDWAWSFAEKISFAELGNYLFRERYLASIVQGISVKLLGHDSFGWRFSCLYLSALGIALFYLFCKTFISRNSAIVAASLLAFSHYVMTFGKIGYTHLQGLFILSLTLALASWALRWKQPFAFALLGSAMASSFYLFPTSLYALPASLLLLFLYYPPTSRKPIFHWLIMVITWLTMLYPLAMQPYYWEALIPGTIFNRVDLVQTPTLLSQHFQQNLFYSFFSILYIREGHYIASSFIDPITAAFVILGFFVLLYQTRHQKFAVFTALNYVIFLIIVGTSHDRDAPPTTRMFMMLPWVALIGTWGITWIVEYLKKVKFFEHDSKMHLITSFLLILIATANLIQAYKVSYEHYAGFQSAESLFVGVTQNIHFTQPDTPKNFVVINGDSWGIEGLLKFQDVYPHLAWFHLYQIRIQEHVLPETSLPLLSDQDTIIMVSPYLDSTLQRAIDTPLTSLGKIRCDVLTPDGQKRFAIYHSLDLPQACKTP